MKNTSILLITALTIFISAFSFPYKKNFHDFDVKDIIGNKVSLSKYKGKVLLVVNVASKCGLTPQYDDLQAIYDKYQDQGLVVLGFPANNFGGQEPGSDEEIKQFCTSKFGVTFPMFSKISVKGDDIHPLYNYLTSKKENGKIDAPVKWNFQKFLIDPNGKLIKSYHPQTKITEEEAIADIEKELKKVKQ